MKNIIPQSNFIMKLVLLLAAVVSAAASPGPDPQRPSKTVPRLGRSLDNHLLNFGTGQLAAAVSAAASPEPDPQRPSKTVPRLGRSLDNQKSILSSRSGSMTSLKRHRRALSGLTSLLMSNLLPPMPKAAPSMPPMVLVGFVEQPVPIPVGIPSPPPVVPPYVPPPPPYVPPPPPYVPPPPPYYPPPPPPPYYPPPPPPPYYPPPPPYTPPPYSPSAVPAQAQLKQGVLEHPIGQLPLEDPEHPQQSDLADLGDPDEAAQHLK